MILGKNNEAIASGPSFSEIPCPPLKRFASGADPGGAIGVIAPLKTYERNFIHHDFV